MKIWIPIKNGPPTYTANQRRWTTRGGKPVTYPDAKIKRTKEILMRCLVQYKPLTPYTCPVSLSVTLIYPYRKSERKSIIAAGQVVPKITRPDADNSMKLLQDCMTEVGYWPDDALITDLRVKKCWGPEPGILMTIEEDGHEDLCDENQ